MARLLERCRQLGIRRYCIDTFWYTDNLNRARCSEKE
ncbi:MAG: hypothetical protein BWY83_01360 [bacterium ADurb.Bin478]|nr:MAG: hypothetical protein BWY83_01360 [bacterium ADurb.Bin478]